MTDATSDYTAKDIQVLEGLEGVRKRPAMYIGDIGKRGLHHLIYEITDNATDEALAGYCKNIDIILKTDGSCTVKDDGRGIPTDIHPKTGKSALETVSGTLHAGGKFEKSAYKVSGGLHGVGMSVVNALSEWMEIEVHRDGKIHKLKYDYGKTVDGAKVAGDTNYRGTIVHFKPDGKIFQTTEFDFDYLKERFMELAFLNKGLRIKLSEERTQKTEEFFYEGGIVQFVEFLNKARMKLHTPFYIIKKADNIEVEFAIQYTDSYNEMVYSFVNDIKTIEGGTHLVGFKTALTRVINDYVRNHKIVKEDRKIVGDDAIEGLTAVLSIKIPEPQFEGQTKTKLGNSEVKGIVDSITFEALKTYMEENPDSAKKISAKIVQSMEAREAAQKAKELIRRKNIFETSILPGKLADCEENDPTKSEIYFVEGDSAGGCFSGDTKVALVDGRNLTFKELVEEYNQGKQNFCYSIDNDGRIKIAPILYPRITKRDTEVIKITLDNDEELICTPDHLFMLRDGSYKKAELLRYIEPLMPLYRQISKREKWMTISGYEIVFDPKENRWIYTHIIADRYNISKGKYVRNKNSIVHHSDFNKRNNNPDNLVRMDKQDHIKFHSNLVKETMKRPDVIAKIKAFHQSQRVTEYFKNNSDKKQELSEKAISQWQDENLLKWRSEKTKEQWTPEFRAKRMQAYNRTYQEASLKLMKEILEKKGKLTKEEYEEERTARRNKNLLKYDTVCDRFFENREEILKEAVSNYNHKIKSITRLEEKIDVYDLEVEETHNFALASGVFVHNSSKMARDRRFQAILPLKGKILNVEKAPIHKVLTSEEIKAIVLSIGGGFKDDFDVNKVRYHKILIMTDADVDGSHIRTLILTLFYRYFRPIIDKGYVYIAQPPLYKIKKGKTEKYAYSNDQLNAILKELGEGCELQRYKGLGEMNPQQLWDTTMNNETRTLKKVTIEDAMKADELFSILMGEEVEPRREFIEAYAKEAKNLDI